MRLNVSPSGSAPYTASYPSRTARNTPSSVTSSVTSSLGWDGTGGSVVTAKDSQGLCDLRGSDAIDEPGVHQLVRDRLGTDERTHEKAHDLGVHPRHPLDHVGPPRRPVVGVLRLGDGDDVGNEPEPLH